MMPGPKTARKSRKLRKRGLSFSRPSSRIAFLPVLALYRFYGVISFLAAYSIGK
jgi:hypothetical protein